MTDATQHLHILRGLDESLGGLRHGLQALGDAVHDQMEAAIALLVGDDEAAADAIVAGDDAIDEAYVELEHLAISTIAKHQPVSGDLREILAGAHAALHLERIGDAAVDIARIAAGLKSLDPTASLLQPLLEMGDVVDRMIDVSLKSFAERDAGLVGQLPEMDDLVDDLHDDLVRSLRADRGVAAELAVAVFHVSRLLERTGDHAVDVGEQVWFLLTGELRDLNVEE